MLETVSLFLQILLINIVLSGDNAVVIALASKNLPAAQRKQAVRWGAFGAVALRIGLTLVALVILKVAYLQAIGALLLLWIAVKLLVEDDGPSRVKEASTLSNAVTTIIMADIVMSLDNVLAIAAKADGHIGIIMVGIGISIPIIIWGSSLVMNLLHKYPALVFVGAGILGYTAGEMILKDQKIGRFVDHEVLHWLVPITAGLLVVLVGWIKRKLDKPRTVQ
ncbi:TerC family protein [Paenibacillus sp. J2TS4]|uniref:TerC family protein n=1 Tax=Paenibacillus sp. J2TS4 TaxID=2807194 RepID=UPI001B09CBC8|nr:TerC family protein [Paenibacillus sp. J2TS4]GIP35807.1 putative membrane protein YjbE [Paenibacillus sp. J2TS4]